MPHRTNRRQLCVIHGKESKHVDILRSVGVNPDKVIAHIQKEAR
jgi:hypothetical protein